MNFLIRSLCHLIFQSHLVTDRLKTFTKTIHHQDILEIGSGNHPASIYLDSTNHFTASDLHPQFKTCLRLNLEKMNFKNCYHLIICINVLDDIFNYQIAVDNLHRALKPGGQVFLVVNGLYPLHDLPYDYWRFTEFSLRKIFKKFKHVKIETLGLHHFPSYYVLVATK